MKNLTIVFLFYSLITFSQDTYTFKTGGRIFENNNRMYTSDVETYFGHKPEILNLYKAGRSKKILGNGLLYGGISSFIITHLSKVSERKTQSDGTIKTENNNTMYYVSAGISLIAIPIKIGYSKKIRKAVTLMNEEIKAQKQNTGINFETNIIANSNGIGLKITF